jgi:hypothetical protein
MYLYIFSEPFHHAMFITRKYKSAVQEKYERKIKKKILVNMESLAGSEGKSQYKKLAISLSRFGCARLNSGSIIT